MPTQSDADRAWLAALLLGEGSIGLCFPSAKRGRNDPRALAPQIKLPNTDYAIVLRAAEILEAAKIRHFVTSPSRPSGLGKKPYISANVTNKHGVLAFIRLVGPWLVGRKAREAELLLEFLERACSAKRYYPTDRDYEIALEIRSLHDKGTGERLQRLIAENAERTRDKNSLSA